MIKIKILSLYRAGGCLANLNLLPLFSRIEGYKPVKYIFLIFIIFFIGKNDLKGQVITLKSVLEFQTLNKESAFQQEFEFTGDHFYFLDFEQTEGLLSGNEWFVKKRALENRTSTDSIPLPDVDLRSFTEVVDFSVNKQFVVILRKKSVLILDRSNESKEMMSVDLTEVEEGPFRSCKIFGERIYFKRFTKLERHHSYGPKVIQYDIPQDNFKKLLTKKIQDDAAIQSYKSRAPYLIDINSSEKTLFCHPFNGNIEVFDSEGSNTIAKKQIFSKSSKALIDSLRKSFGKYLATSEGKYLQKAWNDFHYKVSATDKCFIEDSLVYAFYSKAESEKEEVERNKHHKIYELQNDSMHLISHQKISNKANKNSLTKRNFPILFPTSSFPVETSERNIAVLYPGHIKKHLGTSYEEGREKVYSTENESKNRSLLIYTLE